MTKYNNIFWGLEAPFESIKSNKLRSFLTTLGVIFGVASVITMMAVGKGTQKEILEQIVVIGAKNIIIEPIEKNENQQNKKESDYNSASSNKLNLNDIASFKNIVHTISLISPYSSNLSDIIYEGRNTKGIIAGVNNDYFKIFNLSIKGKLFNKQHTTYANPVCLIAHELQKKLFYDRNPLGRYIKVNNIWYKIIGIVDNSNFNHVSDINIDFLKNKNTVYVPIKTYELRNNKNLLSFSDKSKKSKNETNKQLFFNKNHINKIFIQVNEINDLYFTSKLISRIINRKYNGKNFNIIVPLEILKQHEKTKRLFSIVLGIIAGISLLVGGIGIMNIMLASVYERINEIGIRMAVGANKIDIISQFVIEATLICSVGGITGIILGVIMAKSITFFTGITTVITLYSIIISFSISILVGIFFGYSPAKKAAKQNPVLSLRHE
ncbi:MAG: ABC transporter permease [Bacteroidetes bacterium]|nr:ABC transporter permease [Bacteroidota bacterium]